MQITQPPETENIRSSNNSQNIQQNVFRWKFPELFIISIQFGPVNWKDFKPLIIYQKCFNSLFQTVQSKNILKYHEQKFSELIKTVNYFEIKVQILEENHFSILSQTKNVEISRALSLFVATGFFLFLANTKFQTQRKSILRKFNSVCDTKLK